MFDLPVWSRASEALITYFVWVATHDYIHTLMNRWIHRRIFEAPPRKGRGKVVRLLASLRIASPSREFPY